LPRALGIPRWSEQAHEQQGRGKCRQRDNPRHWIGDTRLVQGSIGVAQCPLAKVHRCQGGIRSSSNRGAGHHLTGDRRQRIDQLLDRQGRLPVSGPRPVELLSPLGLVPHVVGHPLRGDVPPPRLVRRFLLALRCRLGRPEPATRHRHAAGCIATGTPAAVLVLLVGVGHGSVPW
jgi:hypothetical protein